MDKFKNYNQFKWVFDAFLINSDNSFDNIERLRGICDEVDNLEIENIAHRATLEIYELIHLPNDNAERLIKTITFETNEIKAQIENLIKKHNLNHADIMPNIQFWFEIIDSFYYFFNFFTKRGIIKSVDEVLTKNKEIGLLENNKNKEIDSINTTLISLEYEEWLNMKKVSKHDIKLKRRLMIVESDFKEFLKYRESKVTKSFLTEKTEDLIRKAVNEEQLKNDITELHLALEILGIEQKFNFWNSESPKCSHIKGVLLKYQLSYKDAIEILENRKESFSKDSKFTKNVIDRIIDYLNITKLDYELKDIDFEDPNNDKNTLIKFSERDNLFNMLDVQECIYRTYFGSDFKYSLSKGGFIMSRCNGKIKKLFPFDADHNSRKEINIDGIEFIQRNAKYNMYEANLEGCFEQLSKEIETNYYHLDDNNKAVYLNDIRNRLGNRLDYCKMMLESYWKSKPIKEELAPKFIDYITTVRKEKFDKIENSMIGNYSLFFRTEEKYKSIYLSLSKKEQLDIRNFYEYYCYEGAIDKEINLNEIQIETITRFLEEFENDSKYKLFLNDQNAKITVTKENKEFVENRTSVLDEFSKSENKEALSLQTEPPNPYQRIFVNGFAFELFEKLRTELIEEFPDEYVSNYSFIMQRMIEKKYLIQENHRKLIEFIDTNFNQKIGEKYSQFTNPTPKVKKRIFKRLNNEYQSKIEALLK
jgi:hypothetical protein